MGDGAGCEVGGADECVGAGAGADDCEWVGLGRGECRARECLGAVECGEADADGPADDAPAPPCAGDMPFGHFFTAALVTYRTPVFETQFCVWPDALVTFAACLLPAVSPYAAAPPPTTTMATTNGITTSFLKRTSAPRNCHSHPLARPRTQAPKPAGLVVAAQPQNA